MAKLMKRKKKTLVFIFIISVIHFLKSPSEIEDERAKREKLEKEEMKFSVFLQRDSAISSQGGVVSSDDELHSLAYDFYRQNCPQAESILGTWLFNYSVFLDDSNGNKNHSVERQATPNKTLRGINEIDMIKEELENACLGVVSCADTLALATRDAVVLAGGPYYPIFTSKRDSTQSYFDEAMDEIPKPNNNITQTLFLFSPEDSNNTNHDGIIASKTSREMGNSSSAVICQGLSTSIPSGARFDNHYYQNLLKGGEDFYLLINN
ncbi:hypothetical protein SADUNF_Sadunf07G0055400 [Salix dunnii]|uniref:peroxidase n=1 Tax=Salix dunnii TaxID=1413687 RepID=A0A835JZH3_9ROSI|nr:hypothetical protein SADUNF_Sadunf07G0055400 [Salix dunnii]